MGELKTDDIPILPAGEVDLEATATGRALLRALRRMFAPRERIVANEDLAAGECGDGRFADEPELHTFELQMREAVKEGEEIEPYPGIAGLWRKRDAD